MILPRIREITTDANGFAAIIIPIIIDEISFSSAKGGNIGNITLVAIQHMKNPSARRIKINFAFIQILEKLNILQLKIIFN